MMLHSGEIANTISGRKTTPFPKISLKSNRCASNTIKKVDRWLIHNAYIEATEKGDEWNSSIFLHVLSSKYISQSDKDSAELYLFGTLHNH